MEIITSLPKYSDGEIDRALMREIRTGLELDKQREKHREELAARRARKMAGARDTEALGRNVATIPAREYYRLVHKYGREEVHSDQFLQYWQKRFPHLSPNKL
jgi:hypothetical protein